MNELPSFVIYLLFLLHAITLGFVWSMRRDMHRDMQALGERVARIEGILQGMNGSFPRRIYATDEVPEHQRDKPESSGEDE